MLGNKKHEKVKRAGSCMSMFYRYDAVIKLKAEVIKIEAIHKAMILGNRMQAKMACVDSSCTCSESEKV